MMTTDVFTWFLALLVGLVLGGFFFVGLWWTIQKGLTAKHPALWFLGSILVRTAVVLVGFYLVSDGKWERMLACLVGFVLARFIVMRYRRFKDVQLTTSKINEQ
jgi:F1F0 ATPase subunit 2